jgi:hypothetical protein
MGGTPPKLLPRLQEYEKAYVLMERMRKATLDALNAAQVGVVDYFAEDQAGTRKPAPGMDRPYPDGLLPPILHKWPGEGPSGLMADWEEKWLPAVIAGHKRTIDDLSLNVIAYGVNGLGGWRVKDSLLDPSAGSLGEAAANMASFAKMPEIGFTKPPWWDQRAAGVVPVPAGTSERSQKMLLLMRDYTETFKWIEKHVEAKDGSYAMLLKEIKKDKPDQARIDEYVKNLEYARYMMAQTEDLANEVHHGKRQDWSDDGSNRSRKTPVVLEGTPPNDFLDLRKRVYDTVPPIPVPGPQPIEVPVPEKPRERNKCPAPRRR